MHLQGIRKLLFAVLGAKHGPEHGESALGHVDGKADLVDFGGVLDSAEMLDAIGAALPAHGRRQVAQLLGQSHGDVGILEAHGAQGQLVEHGSGRLNHRLLRRTNFCFQARTFFRQLGCEAAIAHQNCLVLRDNQVTAVPAEAGKVTDVDRMRNEQGIQIFLVQKLQELPASRAMVHGSIPSPFLTSADSMHSGVDGSNCWSFRAPWIYQTEAGSCLAVVRFCL